MNFFTKHSGSGGRVRWRDGELHRRLGHHVLFLASADGYSYWASPRGFTLPSSAKRQGMLATAVRFTADVLNGVPSIVMGIAIYSLIVMQQKHFSALAGGVALAIMMVPTITRTTEEMLATVPHAVREAALGLGVPKWRTT